MFKPDELFDLAQTGHAGLFEGCEHAWDALKSRGILTRKMTSYGLPAYLRITIGTADEMQATLAAIAAFLRA